MIVKDENDIHQYNITKSLEDVLWQVVKQLTMQLMIK